MILITFVPGTFASTIEYVLRKFTTEGKQFDMPLLTPKEDGSMHNFKKLAHITDGSILAETIIKYSGTDKILTPIYPFKYLHTKETFDILNNIELNNNKMVVITVTDLAMAEINMLFQYYKIAIGLGLGLDIFFNAVAHTSDMKQWNNTAILEEWEKREWFSLFYVGYIQEWLDGKKYINNKSLLISSSDILFDTKNVFNQVISYCEFSNDNEEQLDEFIAIWKSKQQYVLDEYKDINQFVESTIKNVYYILEHSSIISEAIIQQKLRSNGYEIRCWGLNIFPTQSQDLHNLLEKI